MYDLRGNHGADGPMKPACSVGLVLAAATVLVAAQDNPYRTIEGWAKLPEGRTWGSTSAVEVDKDGTVDLGRRALRRQQLPRPGDRPDVAAADRAEVRRRLASWSTSFGQGMLIFPHGIHVDRDGNVWVTDGQDNAPRPAARRRGRRAPAAAGAPRWGRCLARPRAIRSSSSAPTASCC